ncbi:AzlD domain-containing protein [Agrilactobacillus yilanensis]|uniref:AzlD domain-containing protein n=1 Tax=Agrilactobacillus yilanensis TaxID=2485997 RepID=A0ABW4JAM5_9LACO|nr:AzlD domain-containing protein [Agrilactobacillus yilanensis]
MTSKVYLTIFLCGLATWLIRVVPFMLVKNFKIPPMLMRFLSFVPVAILSAIFVESLLIYHTGHWPSINFGNFLASIPAIITAIISKSLLAVVVVGVIAMALIRFLGLV